MPLHECDGHSHDNESEDSLGLSLRQYIDFSRVSCLNEDIQDSGRAILKLHENRLSNTPYLQSSDGDPELLLYIPFTETVTIQSISIRCSHESIESVPPRNIKVFVDRDDLDFETARELPPQLEVELLPLHHFPEGTIDYPLRPAGRFQNVNSITVFFVDNYDESGDSSTGITYVGLKGKGTKMRQGVVTAVYETQGMPKDHKIRDGFGMPGVL
jgi:PITH domain